MLPRTAPVVERICASIQSYRQAVPVQESSVLWGWYQKDRVEVPVAGTGMVWDRLLFPRGSVPEASPRRAERVPVWAVVDATGALTPPALQAVRPDSNP